MVRRLRSRVVRRATRLALLTAAARQHAGSPPDLEGTVSAETPFGPLYVHERDEAVTPYLRMHGTWEPGETALFCERLRPGMTFVDVGAHVGYFTVLAARRVGPRGLVLAFEPHPRNYELLLANVWRNGLTNVVCFPWAVGDATGFVDLNVAPLNTGDHDVNPMSTRSERIRVRIAALDALSVLRPPVDVVKIDVQGAEGAALRGMERLLAGSPRVLVVVEYWPTGLRRFGSDERELLAYMRGLGYTIEVQDPERPGLIAESEADLEQLSRGEGDALWTNLVLTRP